MPAFTTAPASVQRWFSARGSADSTTEMREVLAADVVHSFAGRKVTGREAVIAQLAKMPSGRMGSSMELSVLPGADGHAVTVRGTGPGGEPMPSPGGPMAAMDFRFTLNDDGLIDSIEPHPHHSEPADLSQPLSPGQSAPDFTLPDTSGTSVALEAAKSAATVVVFTCNPCPWALGWHDRIQQVARDYAPQNVRLIQINANDVAVSPKDAPEVSRSRVEEGQFAGPYLLDEGQVVARAWGARHTPDVFVLDPAGTVAYHGAPDADVDDETLNAGWLRSALDAVLGHTAVTPAATQPVGCTIKWTTAA